MPIKINDTFSIERDYANWILYITTPGTNPKTKESVLTTKEIYPSTLMQCFNRILDITAGEAETVKELKTLLINCEKEILKALEGVGIGHLRTSQELERKDGRSKRKSEGNESNNSNENKGVEREIQIEEPKELDC